ncbi:Plasmid recombination enzyme [Chlamydia trachomatis]|nr:Plasmid recombination enzyme [Chlamydia trachomatis]
MAHVAKYTRGAVNGLSNHIDRKTENHSNQDIDISKSDLNYDLCEKNGDMLQRFNQRLSEVYCMNRKDVKASADWLVTLPKELDDKSPAEQRQFFEATKEFLDDRYGKENNISAMVHMDETQPHMHYAFVPVVYDEKKEREKVSAKLVLNRQDLQSFHEDLDKDLKSRIPQIYERGVVNGQTVGVETVEELKQLQGREKALKQALKELNDRKEVLTSQTATLKQDYEQYESVKQKVATTRIESRPIKEKVGFLKREEVDTGYVKVAKEDFETLKAAYQYMPVAKQELQVAERKAEGEHQERLKYMTKYQETAETLKTTKRELSVLKQFASYVSDFVQKTLGIDIFEQFKTHQQEKVQERHRDDFERGR